MTENADALLRQVSVPCSLDQMRLTRVDVTMNLLFEDAGLVQRYLRILKKGLILPRYHLEWFHKGNGRAGNVKEANSHSHKQQCKSAAFFAYDKTAQLEMTGRFPESLTGKRILRLEVQLRRQAMKKWVSRKAMEQPHHLLKELYGKTETIMKWYLKGMKILNGKHVRYEDAAALVSAVKGDKNRKRMLYLLRKVSDSRDLSAALRKLKKHFGLKNGQTERVFKKFAQLGISPIILPNSERDSLPAIENLL